MRPQHPRRRRSEAQAATLDPVALSLAIWLALTVAIVAVGRISQNTAEPSRASPAPAIVVY